MQKQLKDRLVALFSANRLTHYTLPELSHLVGGIITDKTLDSLVASGIISKYASTRGTTYAWSFSQPVVMSKAMQARAAHRGKTLKEVDHTTLEHQSFEEELALKGTEAVREELAAIRSNRAISKYNTKPLYEPNVEALYSLAKNKDVC